MVSRAVFLDRDGTIAKDVHYCSRPEDFEILPTVIEAIKLFNENGFKVVVVTNQSGIARGYFDEAMLARIHKKMVDQITANGARLDAIYYCPHHPDDHCDCRKPSVSMFRRAAEELAIDLKKSCVIGDMQIDIQAGKNLGCKTILVTTGPVVPTEFEHPPDFTAGSLLEAAKWMVKLTE